jgi:hypothetical protein
MQPRLALNSCLASLTQRVAANLLGSTFCHVCVGNWELVDEQGGFEG